MTDRQDPARVAVLMGSYNGALFLDTQLESIEAQSVEQIDIWISDDGSTDGTIERLAEWRKRWRKGRFEVLAGPRKGFSENYRSLICNPDIVADYYAYADQDDIWETAKLEAALQWMQQTPADRPRLFCSRTLLITKSGAEIGLSPLFTRPPSFPNALVQSIAGGNTMLMDQAARSVLAQASARTSFHSHDWWTYLLLSGVGAAIHYSPRPLVRYRQHGGNTYGENRSLFARMNRLKRLFEGQFHNWTEANLKSLSLNLDLLEPAALRSYGSFRKAREIGMPLRLLHLMRSGVHRQTATGTLALLLAGACGRF